ncbi:hypothetical protein OAP56_00185, partial [Rickettsiaceae bacterium]|nr:hypothetical protein [Rickettsiaceae bacterium]
MKNEFLNDFSWFYKKFKKPIFAWYGFWWSIGALFLLYFLSTFVYVGYNIIFVEPKEAAKKEYYSIKNYMEDGRSAGGVDGDKDWEKYVWKEVNGKIPTNYTKLEDTLWEQYKKEIKEYESLAQSEKEEYLSQFENSERSEKLAEFRLEGGKFLSEKKLENVFGIAKDFYIDYVDKKIKREDYASEDEYVKARRKEAWRVTYEYEYA